MPDKERAYLQRRAEEELDCAQRAQHPAAAGAHYHLLGLYLDRLYPEQGKANANPLAYRH